MSGYTLEKFALAIGFESEQKLKDVLKSEASSEVHNELLLYAYGKAVGFELSNEKALEILDVLVLLQGSESREDVLTSYGAETVRSECYTQALAEVIISNYK